jgi:hypothetical protein
MKNDIKRKKKLEKENWTVIIIDTFLGFALLSVIIALGFVMALI